MLMTIFIVMEVVTVICFGVAFFVKNPWIWAFSLVLSATMIFASFAIQENIAVVDNQTLGNQITYQYKVLNNYTQDPALEGLNIGIFGLSLLLFFWDTFEMYKNQKIEKEENG